MEIYVKYIQMELNQFISVLKQSFEQSVVWHHQTTSYSEHKALNNYYEEIIPLLDGLDFLYYHIDGDMMPSTIIPFF